MPERGRSPPYPYDPNEHTPPAWDQTVQHRDVSPEISVSNPSTPLQSQSPPQYPGPREGSPWATKEHPTVTVQSCEDPFRLSRWQRIRYWANQTWAYEIAACCISAITLAGVIILLATRQNKPLPEWPALITLNSLIAVLTTIMKGCMIFAVAEGISQQKWSWFLEPRKLSDLATFDSASRGPWGSLLFLCSGRLDIIATLGAAITVIALAIDPFAQQVFLFESCTLPVNDTRASIPRVQTFAPYVAGDRTFVGGAQMAGLSRLLRSSYSAMIEPDAHLPPRLDPSCPAGNCTWIAPGGHYSTLTLDHECIDITSKIVNTTGRMDNVSTYKYGIYTTDDWDRPKNLTIDYSTLMASLPGYEWFTNTRAAPYANDSLFAFGALYWKGAGQETSTQDNTAHGIACHLWMSHKYLNAEVRSGVLTETVVNSTRFLGFQKLTRFVRDGEWHNCSGERGPTRDATLPLVNGQTIMTNHDRMLYYGHLAPVNLTWFDPSCAVQTGPLITTNLKSYLESLFTVRLTGALASLDLAASSSLMGSNSTVGNEMHLSAFLNAGNASFESIDRYMGAVTGAMSATMRTSANLTMRENRPASGTVQVVKTCARVRWGWLVLPAALTVLTVVFVVATVERAAKCRGQAEWPGLIKSSPLGLLLYGPVEGGFGRYAGPKDLVMMEAAAAGVRSTLERKGQ